MRIPALHQERESEASTESCVRCDRLHRRTATGFSHGDSSVRWIFCQSVRSRPLFGGGDVADIEPRTVASRGFHVLGFGDLTLSAQVGIGEVVRGVAG